MGPHPNVWAVIQGFIRQEADACRQIMSNAADLDMRENTGRKSLGEQTRQQIKSVVAELWPLATQSLPAKAGSHSQQEIV